MLSITGLMPLDLYYMPYTHSLLGCTIWSLAAAIIFATTMSQPGRRMIGGMVTGALVLSHWFLDLLVHRHDLGLLGFLYDVGFAPSQRLPFTRQLD